MARSKLRAELERLADSPMVGNISKQMKVYEQRVKHLAQEFDHKSRDARTKSRHHLDRLASQVKKTRGEVETKIVTLLNHESKRLNKSMNDLLGYVKTIAKREKAEASKTGKATAKVTKTVSRKPTTRARKSTAKSPAKS